MRRSRGAIRALALEVRIWAVRAGFTLGRFMPLRRRVVLATTHDPVLRGNLAIIRDELARRHPAIPLVVLAHRAARGRRARFAALRLALRAGYHLATARLFIVDDYFLPVYVVRPRGGTTIVQTWHASGAFKQFGYSVLDKSFGADRALTDRIAIHSNYDICLVSSTSVAPHYAEAFRLPLDRFVSRLGIPRTDVLFGEERIARVTADVRRRYSIPDGRRIVLYAPTFRGDSVVDARFNDALDLRRLRDVLGDDHVVLVRLHPFIRDRAAIDPALDGFAIDVSDEPDIHDLLLVSDVLITDYSSVIFEYSLLGRPMVFFAPDREAYERERGFYFDYRSGVPGPVFETTDDLARHLRAGTFDADRVEAFRRASFDVADGESTARFVAEIVLPALRPRP